MLHSILECLQAASIQWNEYKYDSASGLSDCQHSEMSTRDTSSISLQMFCGHFGRRWSSDLTFWCPAGIQGMSADVGAELAWHLTRNVSLMPCLNGGVRDVISIPWHYYGHICAEMPLNTSTHFDRIYTGLGSRKWNHYWSKQLSSLSRRNLYVMQSRDLCWSHLKP